MSHLYDLRHRIDASYGVRLIADSHQLRPWVKLACKVLHVKRAVALPDTDLANQHAAFGERVPWRDVGIVVEYGRDDFIPFVELAADSPAEAKRQRCHVRTEDHFVRVAP